ncbi:MAG: NAD(P)/FAD-dependent oxidoreductase [Candidatus Spechtbacterales bacterium]
MRNIVILGAGFAGLRTALKLEKSGLHDPAWRIILVDKNSYETHTPSLYEAASAYRWKGILHIQKFEEALGVSVCLSMSEILGGKNITFVRGAVRGVDFWNNEVKLESGDSIHYEYLVFALGSETAYYGISGAEKYCYALKTLEDSFRIRRRLEDVFSQAKRGEAIRIVIVGGGATGVETIAEIATYSRHLAKDHGLEYADVHISLFEARDTILASNPRSQREGVLRRLGKLGVEISTNTRIQEVLPDCVSFVGGRKCDADIVLWGAGTKGLSLLREMNGLELNDKGFIAVDKFLQAKGLRKVFAIGDNAAFVDEATGNSAPATAFIAEQQADTVSKNIIRTSSGQPLLEYKVSIPGYVISCGGKYAVARIFGVTFSGFFGWAVKKLIDLKYFTSIFPFPSALTLWIRELRLFTRND